MSSEINEQYLNQAFENFNNEKNKLYQDLKNDKELNKTKMIESKINTVEKITKEILKYRNLLIKSKMKDF